MEPRRWNRLQEPATEILCLRWTDSHYIFASNIHRPCTNLFIQPVKGPIRLSTSDCGYNDNESYEYANADDYKTGGPGADAGGHSGEL